tara:strand:+ start:383 stop:580 length:198 start_codon:yes stop_codon:yes gene_type:complete
MTIQETIKVSANQSKKTFTIRVSDKDFKSKYRTISYSQQEFDSMESDTENDWKNFLAVSDEYYPV